VCVSVFIILFPITELHRKRIEKLCQCIDSLDRGTDWRME
jgi:hypothetical protein